MIRSMRLFAMLACIGLTVAAGSAQSTQPGVPATGESLEQNPVGGIEQNKVGESSQSGQLMQWLQSIAALGVVVGVIFLLRFVLRRMVRTGGVGFARRQGPLDVLHQVSAGAGRQLLLVRLGRRLLLIGSTTGGLRTLAEVDDETQAAEMMRQLGLEAQAKPARDAEKSEEA